MSETRLKSGPQYELPKMPWLAREFVRYGIVGLKPELIRFKSGMLSPMYMDCRRIFGTVRLRNMILVHFEQFLPAYLGNLYRSFEDVVIAGVAWGCVPMASMLADRLQLPFCYIRWDTKDHGEASQIVGVHSVVGKKIVLFEDVVTRAESSALDIEHYLAEGAQEVQFFSWFGYEFMQAAERFASLGVFHQPMLTYSYLQYAMAEEWKTEMENLGVNDWHQDPDQWTRTAVRQNPSLLARFPKLLETYPDLLAHTVHG